MTAMKRKWYISFPGRRETKTQAMVILVVFVLSNITVRTESRQRNVLVLAECMYCYVWYETNPMI